MKRISTLLFAAITLAASAQNLAFKCDGKVINNGETFYSSRTNETYASIGWLYFEPQIYVVSATGGNVEVTAQSSDDKSIELCFGGTCKTGTNISNSSNLTANQEVDILLHANAEEAEIATFNVTLTAKCGSDVTNITLVMTNDPQYNNSEEPTYFPRKIVMEEATATWCGYCPAGIVGIAQMNKLYPDNFIAIALHDDNEMLPDESYNPFFSLVDGFPSSWINRKDWRYPNPFSIDDIKDKGVAKVTSQAKYVSANEVEIETETVFGFSDNGTTEYRLAYVVTEDNVGPYLQQNFYSNPTEPDNPENLKNWWIHQSSPVEITYNEVARAIYDYDGIQGLLPNTINKGEVYKTKYTLTMPANVQNINNVKIVTLLLDTKTGEILNADRCAISDIPITSLSSIKADGSANQGIYNGLGVKVRTNDASTKGLNKGFYIMKDKKLIIR